MKKALVTGCTGQDGSFLAEFLLNCGYKVYGLTRRTSSSNFDRIRHIINDIEIYQSDMTDQSSLIRMLAAIQPDEIYNLAAQSYVAASWEQPLTTADTTALGPNRLLEAIRHTKMPIKFYQASSSEMFGLVSESPQNENTKFHPRSPYGVSKLYGHWITVNYRESYGMFAVSGILFNHESERRGEEFVTRKITKAVAKIKAGLQDKLFLGNLDSKRDWGYAKDYVKAMWLMLQQSQPEDYVIATGETHTVREFVELAFDRVNLDWRQHVIIDEKLLRPAEVHLLCGDASRAKQQLKWEPEVTFNGLVNLMVDADCAAVKAGHV